MTPIKQLAEEGLRPCPLCQGEAVGIDHPPHTHVFATLMPDHPGSYSIECPRCNLGLLADTEELAKAAWNSRVQSKENETERTAAVAETLARAVKVCKLQIFRADLFPDQAADQCAEAISALAPRSDLVCVPRGRIEMLTRALETIRDECFSGNAYDIAVSALAAVEADKEAK